MFSSPPLPTPDNEYRLGRYEVSASTLEQAGVPLEDLIGDHVDDLDPTHVMKAGSTGGPLDTVPALPTDGWRVIAGSIPPSVDERLLRPPWEFYPECALAAPWPHRSPEWIVLQLGRRVEHLASSRIYGRPDLDPRTAHGSGWRSEFAAERIDAGRAGRRRGLSLAFAEPRLDMVVGGGQPVLVVLTNERNVPWLNRAPLWEHDSDGVTGSVTTIDGRPLPRREAIDSILGIPGGRLSDLMPAESVRIEAFFLDPPLSHLPVGRYVLGAELWSLHLTAPGIPLTVTAHPGVR